MAVLDTFRGERLGELFGHFRLYRRSHGDPYLSCHFPGNGWRQQVSDLPIGLQRDRLQQMIE